MKKQLIIIENSRLSVHYEDKQVTNLTMEHSIYRRNEIYAGTIASILPSLNAAFIILNTSAKNGFLHLDDLKLNNKVIKHSKYISYTEKQNILVQIKKEPTKTKGPSLTTHMYISGRYMDIYPCRDLLCVEKDIINEKQKIYLKAIGHLIKPNTIGLTIKTSTLKANTTFLLKELTILKQRWKKIALQAKTNISTGLISKNKNFLIKMLEHHYNFDLNYIGVDSKPAAFFIKNIIKHFYKIHSLVIEYHSDTGSLIGRYDTDLILHSFMVPKININLGAHIIIEKTEALTTIDVNSGSFIKSSNSRSTSFWTNYAAANEISTQIKIRNIAGIIIIDFIDSGNQEDQLKILFHLNKLLKKDIIPTTIIQMSELGLVEVTRSRQGQSIYDAFSINCNRCNGTGYITKGLTPVSFKQYNLVTQLIPSFSDSVDI
jgi:ribonuclease E